MPSDRQNSGGFFADFDVTAMLSAPSGARRRAGDGNFRFFAFFDGYNKLLLYIS